MTSAQCDPLGHALLAPPDHALLLESIRLDLGYRMNVYP